MKLRSLLLFVPFTLAFVGRTSPGQAAEAPAHAPIPPALGFHRLDTVPFRGKQDDIYFADRRTGWYGNGEGKLYRTLDGGEHWDEIWNEPGTFIRALGFVDRQTGVLGNVGTDYFPNVTDTTPLYRTTDGGLTWDAARIDGPTPKGICAIDIFREPFINHGVLGYRTTVWAGGRVGGPAYLLRSSDEGATFTSRDMSAQTAMILDVKFLSAKVGFIAGATSADVEKSHALVLRTADGGATWQKVYESTRPWEITWKLSFPTDTTGFVSVQNYDPDTANTARFVAKTTDGGLHWQELPLASDHATQEFGVGFVDARHGWVGGLNASYETTDGGSSWKAVDLGRAVNRIRVVRDSQGTDVVAIGSTVVKSTLPPR